MKKDDLYIFAFRGNISEEVLNKLEIKNKFIVNSKSKDISTFVNTILPQINKNTFILGFGKYKTGLNGNIKVETHCTNQFRNHKERKDLIEIEISKSIKAVNEIKKTRTIGSSYCNLISYLFASKLNPNKYSFIHLPEKADVKTIFRELNLLLDENFND